MFDFNFHSKIIPFLNKLGKNELTLENILEEDSIIEDIKNNNNSHFLKFFTNEKIKKLIDYSTKLPSSNDHNIGYKYPFNATEILCSENPNFQKNLMSEKAFITKENNIISLKEKLKKAKNIQKGGFISELFKIINKVKKEINNIKEDEEFDYEKEEDLDLDDIDNLDIDDNKEIKESTEKKNTKVIYENVDYLLQFLKESDETKQNYVLVGYFYKILNSLINIHSTKIFHYLFDYPKKEEFDILGLFIKNMNRKSMCNIINKLLIFDDGLISKYDEKKMDLMNKIFDELNITNEKDKYESICDSLSLVVSNTQFFDLFMTKNNLIEKLYNILFKCEKNSKKINSLLKLLIKINENISAHFEVHYTSNLRESTTNNFNAERLYSQDKSISSYDDNPELLKNYLGFIFEILKKNKFSFLEDMLNCDQKENEEFMSTYMEKQKKIGLKKILQTEYLKTILDIFVNSYASKYHEKTIETLIKYANEKNIFWNLHNLFFLFPFSNIYQFYYKRIIEIVINENSPSFLIDAFFNESIGEKRNLIELYINNFVSNIKFNFKLTNTNSFSPCFPFIISLLNKIYISQNVNVKLIIEKSKNLSVLYEIMGEEIKNIFSKKLLLENELKNLGFNDDDEINLSTFGPKNLMEIFDENCKIYEIYKKGENYQKILAEKKERIEKEKNEKNNGVNKMSKKGLEFIDDLDEEDNSHLFKLEKSKLDNEKEKFLSMLNKPIDEENKSKVNHLEENMDINKNDINIDKINEESDKINDDSTPNPIENKIYHVDYNCNGNKINNINNDKKD